MNIDLPTWNGTVCKDIYDNIREQANQGLIRACQIYDGYCRTQDAILYEIFTSELDKIQTNLNIIAKENPVWAKEESEKLLDLGMEIIEHGNVSEYQVTMIMYLGGAISGT